MYDAFSTNYDRFVDWDGRLAAELPFIEQQLQTVDARRVLDTACGTGMHAIALAQRGYNVVGTDLSAGMIEQARINATEAGADVQFEVLGFGELSAQAGDDFDAVLCLGNSLPHVLTPEDLAAALADFAACLRSGGLLLIQNRNFDAVLTDQARWMPPQTHREGEREWLFLRFYDFEPDGRLTFNVLTLHREGTSDWHQEITSTKLWPLTQANLTEAVKAAGFDATSHFGNLEGAPFNINGSPNLVMTAYRQDG